MMTTTPTTTKRKSSSEQQQNIQIGEEEEEEDEEKSGGDRKIIRRWCGVFYWTSVLLFLLMGVVSNYYTQERQDDENNNNVGKRRRRQRRRLMFGTDVSEAMAAESKGVQYRDLDGSPLPALAIAKKYGHQWARVRVMVDPDGRYGLFQDLDYVLAMARDIKHNYNMQLLLDFHYSHWWSDGSNQWIPLSWRKQTQQGGHEVLPSLTELQQLVYHHTYEFLQALQAQETLPDAVQVGNQIMSGMLWDEGRIPDHWNDFVQITKSAVQAIRDVVLLSSSLSSNRQDVAAVKQSVVATTLPKIVIHLNGGGDIHGCEKWFQSYLDLGGTVDIIGLSYYPMWHGSFSDLSNNVNNLAAKFNLDVWVVETAYFWKGYPCNSDDAKCHELLPFDLTEDGQYKYLQALQNVLETNTTNCTALFYWGSHWSQPEKWFVTASGSETWEETARRALFNDNGQALKGWTAWNNNNNNHQFAPSSTSDITPTRFLRLL